MSDDNEAAAAAGKNDFDVVHLLNADCWECVFDHLDPFSQVQLAQTCNGLKKIFDGYASRRYRCINTEDPFIGNLDAKCLDKLLSSIGKYAKCYAVPRRDNYESRSEYQQFLQTQRKNYFLPCGMNEIERSIRDDTFYRHFFLIPVRKCRNLESFEMGKCYTGNKYKYEVLCELPKLKHVFIWTYKALEFMFLENLVNKVGCPLESLSIKGRPQTSEIVEIICRILSLKKLCISSEAIPTMSLLMLNQMEILSLTSKSITNEDVLQILRGLPNLHTLQLRQCELITNQFVIDAHNWIKENSKVRNKITIYVQGSSIDWNNLNEHNELLEIIPKEYHELLLLKGEFSSAYC